MFSRSNPHAGLNRVCAVAYVIAAVLLVMTVNTWRANADTIGTPPRIDCAHVHGANADTCRAEGWSITRRWAIGPRDVLRRANLPWCAQEDGSGPRPCIWVGTIMGNHHGLTYIVHKRFRVRYVWPVSPVNARWQWVSGRLAHRLADGGVVPSRRYTHAHPWRRCVVHYADTTVVKCADGVRVTS